MSIKRLKKGRGGKMMKDLRGREALLLVSRDTLT